MRHFPVFLDMSGTGVVVSGGGETAVAKLRLLLKSEAKISVFARDAHPDIRRWAAAGRLTLHESEVEASDLTGARVLYAAEDDAAADARVADMGARAGLLVNVVDNLEASDFITPAIVDRDPVTVAIGTEGAAPVLARKIKADVEAMLPSSLGALARIAQGFRDLADRLPKGAPRRRFWSRFFFEVGPRALQRGGPVAAEESLHDLAIDAMTDRQRPGRVSLVGAGPGDPDLLTRRAAKLLHEADVVIHDRLVSAEILELARREAIVIEAGKTGFGASWRQEDINAEMIRHASNGHHVVRLKGGDPAIFGRLEEEVSALVSAGIAHEVVPGITAASGAVAAIGGSLTERGRNAAVRILTGHDTKGFADHDWRALAQPGEVAAIYMGKRAAKYLRGRLMMFGAGGDVPVTIVENATRADQRVFETTLQGLPETLDAAEPLGPVVILYGITARRNVGLLNEDMKGVI